MTDASPTLADLSGAEAHQVATLNRLDRPLLDALLGLVTLADDVAGSTSVLERLNHEAPDVCLDLADLGRRSRESLVRELGRNLEDATLMPLAGDPRTLAAAVLELLAAGEVELATRPQRIIVAVSLGRWLTAGSSTANREVQ